MTSPMTFGWRMRDSGRWISLQKTMMMNAWTRNSVKGFAGEYVMGLRPEMMLVSLEEDPAISIRRKNKLIDNQRWRFRWGSRCVI